MHTFIKTFLASVLIALSGAAAAQATSGSIVGDAGAGDNVTIVGTNNGFKRDVVVDKDGKYKARNIPIGSYNVILLRKDGTMNTMSNILVRPGVTIRVSSPATPVAPQSAETASP